MVYEAVLTAEEVKKFFGNFYELESAKTTKVEITPNNEHTGFVVTLTPEEGICAGLLDDCFTSGLLSYWGWREKFQKK